MSNHTKEQVEAQRDQVTAERDAYRRAAMQAEANELILHRRLSEYVDAELSHYKTRAEALEKQLEEQNLPEEEPAEAEEESS